MSDINVAILIAAYLTGGFVCYRWGRQSGDLRAFEASYERDEARRTANYWQRRAATLMSGYDDPCEVCADTPLTCPPGSLSECHGIMPDYEEGYTDES
jgi:hypothetical protein